MKNRNGGGEADAGSMAGYDPNLGLPKKQVANSGYTPKTGPMAPAHPGSIKHNSNPNNHSKAGTPIVGGVNGANMA